MSRYPQLITSHKNQIKQRFNRASQTYDLHAMIQYTCAQHLARLIQQYFPYFSPKSILDIGAGTGYMTQALLPYFPASHYLLNDLSPNMLHQAKSRLGNKSNLSFQVGDMEKVAFDAHELIMSNFALQWADDLVALLSRLYESATLMAFTCLLEGTFEEWSALLTHHALPSPTYAYPSEQTLTQYLTSIKPQHCHSDTQDFILHFAGPIDFMKYLQQLGASSPHHALSISQLRTFLRQNRSPFHITYKVYFGLIGK